MRPSILPAIISSLALTCSLLISPFADAADRKLKSERLVRQSTQTLRYFVDESSFTGLWKTAEQAQAIIVVPNSTRAGFIFGGSAGDAVMIARNADGSWSGPTFLTLGSISFGLQVGGEVSELVLLAMTNRGKERILSSNVKLGGDLSIAAGPVGVGAKAKTADILAFSRSRGLYGGLSLEGSLLKIRHKLNHAYYGSAVTPVDIVFKGVEDRQTSLPLRDAAQSLAARHQVYVASKTPKTQSLAKAERQNIQLSQPRENPPRIYDRSTYNRNNQYPVDSQPQTGASSRSYSQPTQATSTNYNRNTDYSYQGNLNVPELAGGAPVSDGRVVYDDDAVYGAPLAPIDDRP